MHTAKDSLIFSPLFVCAVVLVAVIDLFHQTTYLGQYDLMIIFVLTQTFSRLIQP